MSKEKKISIRHYENKNLKPFKFENGEIHPLYFQISFNKKRYSFKSNLLDDFLFNLFEYYNSRNDSFKYSGFVYNGLIKHDTLIINLVIDKIIEDTEWKVSFDEDDDELKTQLKYSNELIDMVIELTIINERDNEREQVRTIAE